jgi:hypothetical protein
MTSIRCRRTGLFLAFLPLAGGCGAMTDSCGPETRDVTASTSESTSSLSDYAQVMLTQDHGGPGSFYWHIEGPALPLGEVDPYPYEEHVLAARLLDGVAEVALLVQAGRTVLDLTTDIPGQERMLRPLETVVFRDWRRVPCD